MSTSRGSSIATTYAFQCHSQASCFRILNIKFNSLKLKCGEFRPMFSVLYLLESVTNVILVFCGSVLGVGIRKGFYLYLSTDWFEHFLVMLSNDEAHSVKGMQEDIVQ